MIKIYSPRIHNLGDFAHCLPALSGLYKTFGRKISLGICDRLQRFNGIKELLMNQEMFHEVKFMYEENVYALSANQYLILDDSGKDLNYNYSPRICHRYYNHLRDTYKIQFDIDDDFELMVPKLNINYLHDKIIIGDRWSPNEAIDVDDRRKSNLLFSINGISHNDSYYLNYSNHIVQNCSLIKYNNNPFITTVTGIAVLSDLMKKETYVLWDDDMRVWQGNSIDYVFDSHFYKNRKVKFAYLKDFVYDRKL